MEEIFTCEFHDCNKYYEDPVLLPCGNSICREHLIDVSTYECQFCGDLHVVPEYGYELNKNFIEIMNLHLHLNDSQKEAIKALRLFELTIDEFHIVTQSLETHLFEYIISIKNKINKELDSLHEDTDAFELEMKNLINEYDNECKNNLVSLKNLKDLNSYEYESLKVDHYNFRQELRSPHLSKRRLAQLMVEINEKINEYKQVIEKYKNDILNNSVENSDLSFPISSLTNMNFRFSEHFGVCLKTLQGHTEGVRAIKLLNKDKLVSASGDKSIKIWNLYTGECTATLEGHKNAVICLELLSHNKLISGSWDTNIKIWDLDRKKCIVTLKGHKSFVSCLQLYKNELLISGCGDSKIKIWDLKTFKCIKTLREHKASISSIKVTNNGKMISGSNDNTIKIWNMADFSCIRTLRSHTAPVNCIEIISDEKFASGSSDQTIRVWNIRNGYCICSLKDTAPIWSLKAISNQILVSGNQSIYGNIKLWDLENKYEIGELKGHAKYVIGLDMLENGHLVSCSGDRSIKVWEI